MKKTYLTELRSEKTEWIWKISFSKYSLKGHGPSIVPGATDTVVIQAKIPNPRVYILYT